LRAAGEKIGADSVYSRRKGREGKRKKGLKRLGDLVLLALVGYGVDYRLLSAWILGFVLLGTLVFSSPGAVGPAVNVDPGKPIPEPVATKCDTQLRNCDIDFVEAAGVSLNTFLPIQLPIGETWKPTYVILASIMKLAGWIVVPVGVAALTGLLQREGAS
jgi:hypothetical protein